MEQFEYSMFSQQKERQKDYSECSKLEDRNDIFNAFNNYFATLGDKLVEKLPSSGTNTFKNYLSSSINNSIFSHPTDKYEISSLIRKLKENKSPGPDNFGPKLVKSMDYAIIDPLEYIFNLSLYTEKAPIKMKTAKVIPVFKKGKTDLMSNYRPLAFLINCSKK